MADPQTTQSRKLIVCCDGTWNRRDAPGGAPTNVAKLARALRPSDDSGTSQLIYYHPGVGTGNRVDHFLGGAFGIGLSGNVQSEYAFLADNFQYTDQIFLFGFSRGAYTVRSLAGLIGLVGLMRKADMDYFPQVYKIYMSRKYREAIVRGQKCAVAKDALRALFPKGEANGQNKKLLDAVEESRRTQDSFHRRMGHGRLARRPVRAEPHCSLSLQLSRYGFERNGQLCIPGAGDRRAARGVPSDPLDPAGRARRPS